MRVVQLALGVARACCALVMVTGCSVDPGEHFQVAEMVYDEDWFYCEVEPFLRDRACGAGDESRGDKAGACHFNVTSYRLSDYSPPVSDSCQGGRATAAPPPEAQASYQNSQNKMSIDLDRAQLLTTPSSTAAHPRKIFDLDDGDVAVIRQWASRYSSQ